MAETIRFPLRVLVVNADSALYGLLEEWLAAQGCTVMQEHGDHPDLVVVDLPYPRQDGQVVLERIERTHPTTPVLALSSSFLPGIDSRGAIARGLGVDSVLPKPVTRESLLATVSGLTG